MDGNPTRKAAKGGQWDSVGHPVGSTAGASPAMVSYGRPGTIPELCCCVSPQGSPGQSHETK